MWKRRLRVESRRCCLAVRRWLGIYKVNARNVFLWALMMMVMNLRAAIISPEIIHETELWTMRNEFTVARDREPSYGARWNFVFKTCFHLYQKHLNDFRVEIILFWKCHTIRTAFANLKSLFRRNLPENLMASCDCPSFINEPHTLRLHLV